MEKIFLRLLGMSELKCVSYKKYFKKRFSLHVACQIAYMHVSLLFDGRPVTLTDRVFNSENVVSWN